MDVIHAFAVAVVVVASVDPPLYVTPTNNITHALGVTNQIDL